jgi:hypothetical protein
MVNPKPKLKPKSKPAAWTPAGYDVSRGVAIMDAILAKYPSITTEDAAAVAGNFMMESYGIPSLYQGQNQKKFGQYQDWGGLGLAQWSGSRRKALEKLANPTSLQTQIDYFASENAGDWANPWNATLQAKTLKDKTYTFADQWEKPKSKDYAPRYQLAQLVYDQRKKREELAQQQRQKKQPQNQQQPSAPEPQGLWDSFLNWTRR